MHYVSYSTWENGSGRRLNGCLLSIRPTVSTFALFFFMFYHPLVAEPQNTALRHGGSYGAASAVNWLGNHQLHIIPDLLVVLLLLAYIADTSNITFPKEPSTSNSIFYLIYHTPGRTSSILLKKSRIKGIQQLKELNTTIFATLFQVFQIYSPHLIPSRTWLDYRLFFQPNLF